MRIRKQWMLLISTIIAAMAATATAIAAESVTFQVKFPVGEVDHQTNTMEMDQTFSGQALPSPKSLSMKMVAETTLKPTKSDATGSTVELTYDSMKISGSMVQTAPAEMDKTFSAFLGKKIMLHYTSAGLVDKVEGVDAIVGKLPPVTARLIHGLLSEDHIKDEFNSGMVQLLPGKAAHVGDTWQTEISHNAGGVAMKIKCDVKLKGIEERDGHKIAQLEFTGKANFDANSLPALSSVSFDSLQQKGTAEFDLTRGWLTSQVFDQTMKGNMQIRVGAKSINVDLDQSIKAKTVTKLAGAGNESAAAKPAKSDAIQ